MEINNSPPISLIPIILGEKTAAKTKPVEKTGGSPDGETQLLKPLISESEKQAAKQKLLNEQSEREQQNLFKDQAGGIENKAINAYLETEQDAQKKYLSEVIGIDVYS